MNKYDEQYKLWFKASYDALQYINNRSEEANQLYNALLDKFNQYVVISNEIDGRQSQLIEISTTFGTLDPTDPNIKEFRFNTGSVLRYDRVLPYGHTDNLEVVNFQTLVNTIQESATVFTGPAGPAGPAGTAGPAGPIGSDAKVVILTSNYQVFQISKTGVVTPTEITFDADGQNLNGSPVFTVYPIGAAILSGSGTSRTVTYANTTTDVITVTVTWDDKSDSISVAKLREGSDAITMLLSNENITVPANNDGSSPDLSTAKTFVEYWVGSTKINPAPGEITITVSNCTAVVDNPVSLYDHVTVTSLTADTGLVNITFTPAGHPAQTKTLTLSKSKAGATGPTGATGATGPAGPTGPIGPIGPNGIGTTMAQAYQVLLTAPQVGPIANRPAASVFPDSYYYATDALAPDGLLGTMYHSDGTNWGPALNPVTIAGRIITGTLSAGSIGVTSMAAYMIMSGTIESLHYENGNSTYTGSGFKMSDQTFGVTYMDGSTGTVTAEFGGDVKIAGLKAAVITNLLNGKVIHYTSAGIYNWTCSEGVQEIELTLEGPGGNGADGNVDHNGGGGGAGAYMKRHIAVTPGVIYTITITNGSGGLASFSGPGFTTITANAGSNGSGIIGGAGGVLTNSPNTGAYHPEYEWSLVGQPGTCGILSNDINGLAGLENGGLAYLNGEGGRGGDSLITQTTGQSGTTGGTASARIRY